MSKTLKALKELAVKCTSAGTTSDVTGDTIDEVLCYIDTNFNVNGQDGADGQDGTNGTSIYASNDNTSTSATTTLAIANLALPTGRAVAIGDLILCVNKTIFIVTAVDETNATVTYLATFS